ncbi:MAG TPA: hypothetical protein VHS96_12600, partial [Bacteroidia bacterium]|nr:hypothetical protein [Bacteroidia bacterium]
MASESIRFNEWDLFLPVFEFKGPHLSFPAFQFKGGLFLRWHLVVEDGLLHKRCKFVESPENQLLSLLRKRILGQGLLFRGQLRMHGHFIHMPL